MSRNTREGSLSRKTMSLSSKKTTQTFIPITDIKDGVVLFKNGSMRMVIIASSINFALKSEEEQTAILLQFQNLLNSLDFSLQILVQSKKLDINPYLAILRERSEVHQNQLLKIQTREYIDFIKNFTDSVKIMTKSFFIVIPYSPPVFAGKAGLFNRLIGRGVPAAEQEIADSLFRESRVQLDQRASVVEQGLRACGIRSARLGTEELIELYYKAFNPKDVG